MSTTSAPTTPQSTPGAIPAVGGERRDAGITTRQLRELAGALERESGYLQSQIRAYGDAQLTLRVAQREEGGPGSAPGDVASDLAEEELLVTLQRADRGRLLLVERAQERVTDGTYGLCQRCGLAIGYPRLRALPWAATCRACASRQERPLRE